MEKVSFQDVEQMDGSTQTFAIIDRGNGEFTSMLKSTYEATLATELADPAPTDKPKK